MTREAGSDRKRYEPTYGGGRIAPVAVIESRGGNEDRVIVENYAGSSKEVVGGEDRGNSFLPVVIPMALLRRMVSCASQQSFSPVLLK
ncbi:MAG: hypothetical protein V3R65_05290 [Acidiferrobacterales bacterium]